MSPGNRPRPVEDQAEAIARVPPRRSTSTPDITCSGTACSMSSRPSPSIPPTRCATDSARTDATLWTARARLTSCNATNPGKTACPAARSRCPPPVPPLKPAGHTSDGEQGPTALRRSVDDCTEATPDSRAGRTTRAPVAPVTRGASLRGTSARRGPVRRSALHLHHRRPLAVLRLGNDADFDRVSRHEPEGVVAATSDAAGRPVGVARAVVHGDAVDQDPDASG